MLPGQLLPGLYEPIAVYGGIALVLLAAGMINQKLSKCINMLGTFGVKITDLDAKENVVPAPNAGSLEPDVQESKESGSSQFVTGDVKAAEIDTNEHDTGNN